ncbi:hypothetical protein F4813DRAFT_194925 [Daldinia decipiens]|uniref:uncharacterized protein n=1 Tax=Daldinia decipiens TaxID=326647 RepID=UPI0020C4A0BE|nr:uncharacterized protein F4813DRAFT_194925 [Daldinia decipiens]KAI1654754.1 hypothetical protein F4813DRAFT_194925 [Daldinia decipiens]
MQLPTVLSCTTNSMAEYDEIYIESWNETVKECEKKLERRDWERALEVNSLEDFRHELRRLRSEYPDEPSRIAITLLYPTLDHYETFARIFVDMMYHPIDTSMMWGLLSLVFKQLALESTGEINPLDNITRWLENIGRKLQDSNDCYQRITDSERVKNDMIELNREIVILWINIIMTFRNKGQGHESFLNKSAIDDLTDIYNAAYQNITEAVRRIKRVAKLAERQAYQMILQSILPLKNQQKEGGSIPCNTLPIAENRLFYGRQDILYQIEDYLKPADTSTRLSSMALYGLGGIGKTQIALAYAYQRLGDLDAVFWIPAENTYTIQQSFSQIAISALKLPRAVPQANQQNMILVLDWLQNTSAKWLLIFDNVDDHSVLESCWPASKHGAVLVTTRDVLVASLPIDTGLEVNEFNNEEGAKFLLHVALSRQCVDGELEAARRVTELLGGLPLALNQMAAFINARGLSISDFYATYIKYDYQLHTQKKNGCKYLGYPHALDTVWEISFAILGNQARACLGVLSFLAADDVPADIFTAAQPDKLPGILSFCTDDLCLGDAIEELTRHSLVRRNIQQRSYRIHRLVQAGYRAKLDNPQQEFEAAVELLLEKIPSQRSSKFDNDEWILYEKYIPQVLSLVKNYNDSQTKPKPLKPNENFVRLLTNSSYAIHDNDTVNIVPELLDTADSAFHKCTEVNQDRLLWALLQYLKCIHHFCTSEFIKSELEMAESLRIRLELLPPNDLLVAVAYSGLGMATGAQGRYEEGLEWLLKAGKIYEGPNEENPSRKLVWCYNISRNYYCMGRYEEAGNILRHALEVANRLQSWYMQVYAHLTFTSLRIRMNSLDEAKKHAETAKHLLEISGTAARFSWLSSYCAYRVGQVAMKQGRLDDAIEETAKATAIGKLVNVPTGILARCVHAYSKALGMDPSRQEESEIQRMEARRLRASLPDGGGDLDDETDEAFEKLVKMDHR